MKHTKLHHIFAAALLPLWLTGASCSEGARLQNLAQDLAECDDGNEMPSKYFCDAIVDCRDASDESFCYDFECGGGDTVGYSSRCDGYEDCDNGRDEEECYRTPHFAPCTPGSSDPGCGGSTNNDVTNNESTFNNDSNSNTSEFEPGPGEIGSACEYTGDCPGECLTSHQSDMPRRFADGYCSAYCGGDYDCPTGSHCSARGECVDACETDDACRDIGYACTDHDADGRDECHSFAGGDLPAGASCSTYAECGGGEAGTCLSGSFGGGYCTLLCAQNPGICPFGFVCQPGASGQMYCLATCETGECQSGSCQEREGYLVCIP